METQTGWITWIRDGAYSGILACRLWKPHLFPRHLRCCLTRCPQRPIDAPLGLRGVGVFSIWGLGFSCWDKWVLPVTSFFENVQSSYKEIFTIKNHVQQMFLHCWFKFQHFNQRVIFYFFIFLFKGRQYRLICWCNNLGMISKYFTYKLSVRIVAGFFNMCQVYPLKVW